MKRWSLCIGLYYLWLSDLPVMSGLNNRKQQQQQQLIAYPHPRTTPTTTISVIFFFFFIIFIIFFITLILITSYYSSTLLYIISYPPRVGEALSSHWIQKENWTIVKNSCDTFDQLDNSQWPMTNDQWSLVIFSDHHQQSNKQFNLLFLFFSSL